MSKPFRFVNHDSEDAPSMASLIMQMMDKGPISVFINTDGNDMSWITIKRQKPILNGKRPKCTKLRKMK